VISGASRFAHIQNQARANGQNVSELARLYTLEGMLARIAASDHAEDFVLKGGVLLAAFALRRATKDIDLEATRIANDAQDVASRVHEIAAIALDDGIEFTLDSIRAESIREGDEYQGIRVKLIGVIGRSENVIGLDISFGDPIWPVPQKVDVPRLLDKDQSAPISILGYPLVR
jgi:Nucleotidyl transferase AbiEii toxin, Type IV TA system